MQTAIVSGIRHKCRDLSCPPGLPCLTERVDGAAKTVVLAVKRKPVLAQITAKVRRCPRNGRQRETPIAIVPFSMRRRETRSTLQARRLAKNKNTGLIWAALKPMNSSRGSEQKEKNAHRTRNCKWCKNCT